ncbi:hypothetical protein RI129_005354 [Pyrocoelia pectoralis]|uniref:Major facilitator superfamily (MFS) profile domain-containing protein n=1 Tax=Pyrocoelia pectoralis TaxID=417401 RepID=A0AAN7VEM0_9COLE
MTNARPLSQILAVLVKNLLALQVGMSLGFVTILIPPLTDVKSNEEIHLDESQTSWISAILPITSMTGSVLSGLVTEPFGRKRSMIFLTIPSLMTWIIFYFSTEMWHIFATLTLQGLTNGFIEAPILAYVSEVTEPHLRGVLSATTTLCTILGVFLEFIVGSFLHWKVAALATGALPIIAFFLLLTIPESPHWLMSHNKPEEAQKSLGWLRGWTTSENVEEEFQELRKHFNKNLSDIENSALEDGHSTVISLIEAQTGGIKIYLKKSFLWPLSLTTFLFVWSGFAGILTLQTYGVIIFATLEVPIDNYFATVLLGCCQFLGSLLCMCIVRCLGKRILALTSVSGLCICNLCLGVYAYVNRIMHLDFTNVNTQSTPEGHQWIPFFLIIMLAFVGSCGPRNLPWTIIGEVFSNDTRGVGCGFAVGAFYLSTFVANKVYLNMDSTLTFPGIYWAYACICFVGLAALYFALPETEGKSLEEISEHFRGNVKLNNKVKRRATKA